MMTETEISEIEAGDSVTVKYRNLQGNISERSGVVVHVNHSGANVDTGEETDGGEPICIHVSSGGRVKSLTGGSDRRISDRVSASETEIWIEQDASESGNSEQDAPEDMTVEGLRNQRKGHLTGYAMDNSSKNTARHAVRAKELERELDSRGVEYVDASDVFAWTRGELDEIPEPGEDSEDADADASEGGEDPEVMTDGGEDATEDASALDAFRYELAASSDDHADSPGDISDDDVFQTARHDMTDADGNLIIRFNAARSGTTTVEADPDTMFKDHYNPTAILMEYYGLTEGVSDALDRLCDAVDSRTLPDARIGVMYVDEDTGRVSAITFNEWTFRFRSSVDVETLKEDMADTVNRRRDVGPEHMTADELRSERRAHISGWALDPAPVNKGKHSRQAHELERELDSRGVSYAPTGEIMAWAEGDREEQPEPPEDSEPASDGGEEPDDDAANPGGEPMTDGGREPMNVSGDEWGDMTLRFEGERNPNNLKDHPRVESEPTSFYSLSVGDVVVLDVGKHTGPADWGQRRTTYFNKTAYRVTRGNRDKTLEPSDGRASELRFNRTNSAHAGAISLWSDRRISADAKAHRVMEAE